MISSMSIWKFINSTKIKGTVKIIEDKMRLFEIRTSNAINITNLTHDLFLGVVAFFLSLILSLERLHTLNEYAQNGNLCKTVEQIRYQCICIY